jgi:hypothetical protein
VRLIAEGRGDRASIAEITEEADIGFGSFYNHFAAFWHGRGMRRRVPPRQLSSQVPTTGSRAGSPR